MVREKAEIRFPEKLEIRIIRDEQKRTKPNVKFKESKKGIICTLSTNESGRDNELAQPLCLNVFSIVWHISDCTSVADAQIRQFYF